MKASGNNHIYIKPKILRRKVIPNKQICVTISLIIPESLRGGTLIKERLSLVILKPSVDLSVLNLNKQDIEFESSESNGLWVNLKVQGSKAIDDDVVPHFGAPRLH